MARLALAVLIGAAVFVSYCRVTVVQLKLNERLIDALHRNDAGNVIRCLRQGADPDSREHSDASEQPRTIFQIVGNRRPDSGFSALSIAAYNDSMPCVRALLLYGANPNVRRPTTVAPVILACRCPEIVAALVEAGEDVNTPLSNGHTALMSAVQANNQGSVNLLLAHGANVNARDVDGCTALMIASAGGFERIVSALLERGADATAVNSAGWTARRYTETNMSRHWQSTARALRRHGASR